MALRDSNQGREYDKFVSTTEGTAVRVATVAGGSVPAGLVDASGTATIAATETVLIQKQTLNGKTGSWFVYNAGAQSIDVKMYAAYAASPSDFVSGSVSTDWDKVGSAETVAAGNTKHMPFNNVYRYVALSATTATSTSIGVTAVLYAL